jgi:hypothetical protein
MGTRQELQEVLEGLQEGVSVYFQPPANGQMSYPAIVYNRDYLSSQYADNFPYARTTRYMITVIDRDPDSLIPDKVAAMPLTVFDRHYTADNLNHDVYRMYF